MRRALGLTTAAGLVAGGLVGLAPTSASAAYDVVAVFDGARLQVCRAAVGGEPVVRFRLDNSASPHAHVAGVTRVRGDGSKTVVARAAGGRVSSFRTVTVRSGDRLTGFAQEPDGPGVAEDFSRGRLPRC